MNMIGYEYKILKSGKPTASEEQLSQFGNDRWKLVCIVEFGGEWYYYFIRIKVN